MCGIDVFNCRQSNEFSVFFACVFVRAGTSVCVGACVRVWSYFSPCVMPGLVFLDLSGRFSCT